MFCTKCKIELCDDARFCSSCGHPTRETDASEVELVRDLVDGAMSFEQQAAESANTERFVRLAMERYDMALSIATSDNHPELYCEVSYYLARLWRFAESRGLELGTISIFEARSILKDMLPVAQRIQHRKYSAFHELYKDVTPGGEFYHNHM